MTHKIIPYGRQTIDQDDINAVVSVLQSDFLTTGPHVDQFQNDLMNYLSMPYGLALSNGTAALHAAMHALGVGAGDEVIVPTMTFVASANAVIYTGAKPVLADVSEDTLLVQVSDIEKKITEKTKAIVTVDYGGQTCDYDGIATLARKYKLKLLVDACHALGSQYKGVKAGNFGDATVFSFHPVKPITTGEGGALVTHQKDVYDKARQFRNHGINTDHQQRQTMGTWYYEMQSLGFNYRMTDIQASLGSSQLKKIDRFIETRNEIARMYDFYFDHHVCLEPLKHLNYGKHGYHLYVVKFKDPYGEKDRQQLFDFLRVKNIYANVHYIPVHFHPFYTQNFGYKKGDFPVAEKCYAKILSLPVFPSMTDEEVQRVISAIQEFCKRYVS